MYHDGRGVDQDHSEALKWWRQAADRNDAGGQNNIGWAYASGKGVPQDFAEAAIWYRKAAEQGLATAQDSLGLLYQQGLGVSVNFEEGRKWRQKALDQGFSSSNFIYPIDYSGRNWTVDGMIGVLFLIFLIFVYRRTVSDAASQTSAPNSA